MLYTYKVSFIKVFNIYSILTFIITFNPMG